MQEKTNFSATKVLKNLYKPKLYPSKCIDPLARSWRQSLCADSHHTELLLRTYLSPFLSCCTLSYWGRSHCSFKSALFFYYILAFPWNHFFFFDIWNFFISSPNTFQNPEWVSFSLKHKSAQQREKCKFTRAAKGIRSCYLVRSFYSSLWAAGLERKGARGVGSDRGIDSFSLALGAALPKLHTLPEFHPPLCPCPLSSTALPDSLQPSIYTECCVSSAPLENMSFVKQGLRPLSQSSTTSDMPYMLWGWLVTA